MAHIAEVTATKKKSAFRRFFFAGGSSPVVVSSLEDFSSRAKREIDDTEPGNESDVANIRSAEVVLFLPSQAQRSIHMPVGGFLFRRPLQPLFPLSPYEQ